MIAHIQGRLVEKTATEVVIDCGGVGYLIHISLHTFSQIGSSENLRLYTYLQIKEDGHTLFGFIDKIERELFKLLISVSGIGGNTARNMLSSIAPKDLLQAIGSSDVKTIQSVKGIGAKTAQRVILDLQEKVLKLYNIDEVSPVINNTNADEALSALEVLGFVRKSAEKVVDKIIKQTPDASVEFIIKQALKNL
ncbi:Holliday junction branch migration protein RuvA [Myroides marinus]|uniref:Holliday junction branch migration complex subunit RuvA n=1 Tax=Myroides marinus TaxID=703342 RepID=A0A161S8M6_9FLAO|nr:Holliday junction branch migration protein RuvA [Myroides marinus]KUF41948.1 Holliday junction ATP-dependent DNA helicase RuvA [Myroides marinus]KZE75965.1 Holliday junction ATP-dependent DNA helicase RuvA [Myroides marinus]MDM1362082.1 Holliday junction branch migration protein RuvA [Myroides marinus]MDM1367213.1 Holliday junction branch migration protein RuvA [Myroides marinus]MDM1374441.1 Holliday junction branch migration protein RuvA [Myroides marinus]